MTYYIDASALAKALIIEPGTNVMTEVLDVAGPDKTLITRLGLVEVASAVARLVRQGDLGADEAESVHNVLREPDALLSEVVELTPAVAETAVRCLRKYPLRASDAVHLAAAIENNAQVFVSADIRLLSAAALEDLECLNPAQPPA